MKILVVGPSPDRSKGGMATVIQEIRSDKLLNQKYDIEIFESFIDGNKVTRFLYTTWALLKFKTLYKSYDLFHIHMASYGSTFRKLKYVKFLKKKNKKIIVHIHGAAFMVFYEKLSETNKKYIRDTLNSVDLVIGLSDKWKETFEKELGLTNCVAVNNGIDMDQYKEAITLPEKYQKAFVSLGRLGQRKGTYDLVDALEKAVKKVPDLKCYIAGDGEVDKFKTIINERHLAQNVEIVGWVNFEQKLELLKKVSTVVLPSYNEGLPMAILEGMACGKAIISTTVGAIPEVVKEDNGILIAPGDVEALERALVTCAQNTKRMEAMSKNNIVKINKEFSMKIMHQKLMDYYNQVYFKTSSRA